MTDFLSRFFITISYIILS